MDVIQDLRRFFGTEKFKREESTRWAHIHFPGENEQLAAIVAYSLVEMLGIDFEQLTRETNIVADVGADETCEWQEIQMWIEEELDCYFAPEPALRGRTVADLVDFISRHRLPPPRRKPKRRVLCPADWCFSACLYPEREQH